MENGEASLDSLRTITGYKESSAGYNVRLAEDAYEYTVLLNDESRSGKDLREVRRIGAEFMGSLNKECPYVGQYVFVSGEVVKGVVVMDENNQPQQQFKQETLSHRMVRFHGFTTREPSRNNDWEVVQVFLLEDEEDASYNQFFLTKNTPIAYANIGDIDILYDQPMDELIVDLTVSIPNAIDEVDGAIYSGDADSTIIKRLGDIKIHEIYSDIPAEDISKLGSYIYKAMDFDKEIPYAIEINDSFLTVDEEGSYVTMKISSENNEHKGFEVSAYVGSVEIVRYSQDGRLDQYHIGFRLRVVEDTAGQAEDGPYHITVLARNLVQFESLRQL